MSLITGPTTIQVGADIRASHKQAGHVKDWVKRHNHEDSRLTELLSVPRHGDHTIEDDPSDTELNNNEHSVLIRSKRGWRAEMESWICGAREEGEEESGPSDKELGTAMYGAACSKWLPRSLSLLFGGRKETDVEAQSRRARRQEILTLDRAGVVDGTAGR